MITVNWKVTENYLPNQAIAKQLAKCQFPTTKYYDYERQARVPYNCDSKDEDVLASGLCIFHDENYLKEDKDNRKEREQKVKEKLMDKVRKSVDQKEALFCIGYHLPDIPLEEVNFTKPVYFTNCEFQGAADFRSARFIKETNFNSAKFSGQAASFYSAKFSGEAYFSDATFSGEAYLIRATFSGEASFSQATFSGETSFNSATFAKEASSIIQISKTR